MKKSGAKIHESSWHCEYDGEFKTCLTPPNAPKHYERTPANGDRPSRAKTPADGLHIDASAASDTDGNDDLPCISDDGKAGDLDFWFPKDDGWTFRSNRQNPTAQNVERERMPVQEINVLEGLLAPIVDESKYYLTANSLTSIVTMRWKHSERGLNWGKFTHAKQTVDGLGFKKLHSSSSSSLSVHAYAECVTRAKRRCAWHSSWIYDTRPMTIAPLGHKVGSCEIFTLRSFKKESEI